MEEINRPLAAPRPNGHDNPSPKSPIINPRELYGQPIPERQWIVRDWIPSGGFVTGLYGPGGYGKSLLAMQLMTALALGKPWLGIPVEPVRSLGLFREDPLDELHRRQAAINYWLYGCDFDALGEMRWWPRFGEDNLLMTFTRTGKGELTPLYTLVREAALDLAVKLVVFDTVADTFGGNQNDAGQVRQFVQFGYGQLARAIGGAVLGNAHPSRSGMNSGTGESGSVQWDAAFRSRLYLSAPKKDQTDDAPADPDARVLTRVKSNYAASDETIALRWHDGVLSAEAGDFSDERPSAEDVFLALLEKMTAEGQALSHNSRAGNYAPKVLLGRQDRCEYRRHDFERAMQRLLEMGEIRIEGYGRASDRRHKIVRIVRSDELPV